MPEFIAIVEANADFVISTKLAERVLVETVEWLEPEQLQHILKWKGTREDTEYLLWKNLKKEIAYCEKNLGYRKLRGLGFPKGEPRRAYAATAKKALHLIRFLQRKLDKRDIRAVLLIIDLDTQPSRRHGLEQARLEFAGVRNEFEIVIGASDGKREAWVLNGYEPLDAGEERLLQQKSNELGFDPRKEPERLRSRSKATDFERLRNPKELLDLLTNGDWEREKRCWENTDLTALRSRGITSGLTDYLQEIEDRLVPIVGGVGLSGDSN